MCAGSAANDPGVSALDGTSENAGVPSEELIMTGSAESKEFTLEVAGDGCVVDMVGRAGSDAVTANSSAAVDRVRMVEF